MSLHVDRLNPASETTKRKTKKSIRRVKKKKSLPTGITSTGRKRKVKKETNEEKDRRMQAVELRIAGVTYKEIAATLGYHDASGAKKAIDRTLDRIEMDAAKETVIMDLSRLDEFQMRCMHALRQNGDLNQIDRVMRVMEFRYRLLNINDETVRELQNSRGIAGPTTSNTNNVMVVNAAPETQKEFLEKIMGAVGVDTSSDEAQEYINEKTRTSPRPLPLLAGSANETKNAAAGAKKLEEEAVDVEFWEDEGE